MRRATLRALTQLAGPEIDSGARLLGYHSVGDGTNSLSIAPELFEAHLAWLMGQGVEFITLSTWWDRIRAGRPRLRPEVVLTFDDGYLGVWLQAAPCLGALGIPATVFVPVDYVGRSNLYDCGRGVPVLQLMDWDELERLQQAGWDIQSHGCGHVALPGQPEPVLVDEVGRSKLVLEQRLGDGARFFCYPYGAVDRRAATAVRLAGYAGGVGCTGGALPREPGPELASLRRIMADHCRTVEDLALRCSTGYRRLDACRLLVAGRVG